MHTGDFVISGNTTYIASFHLFMTFGPVVFCKEDTYVDFVCLQKSAENDKDGTNSTMEDGPGEGFTVLAAKSLFLGQKVLNWQLIDFSVIYNVIDTVACKSIRHPETLQIC